MRYFKDVHNYQACILKRDKMLNGKTFPSGSIIVIDNYCSSFGEGHDIYICTQFPRHYNGNKPILKLWTYNEGIDLWETDIFQNEITRLICKVYATSAPKISKLFMEDSQAEKLMKKETVCKQGKGGRIRDNIINNPVNYRQVTEYAYWENLNNAHSGNASVVASHIYN